MDIEDRNDNSAKDEIVLDDEIHIHIFKPQISFDLQGNSYSWGLCSCGEKEM